MKACAIVGLSRLFEACGLYKVTDVGERFDRRTRVIMTVLPRIVMPGTQSGWLFREQTCLSCVLSTLVRAPRWVENVALVVAIQLVSASSWSQLEVRLSICAEQQAPVWCTWATCAVAWVCWSVLRVCFHGCVGVRWPSLWPSVLPASLASFVLVTPRAHAGAHVTGTCMPVSQCYERPIVERAK